MKSLMLRYHPDELPHASKDSSLDWNWTLISWDLVRETRDDGRTFVQFILGPGVLLTHYGLENGYTWSRKTSSFVPNATLTSRQTHEQLMTDLAKANTERYLYAGFEMAASPYLFTVSQEDHPDWPRKWMFPVSNTPIPVRSIGEVLVIHQEQEPKTFYPVQDVLNASYPARRKHLRRHHKTT